MSFSTALRVFLPPAPPPPPVGAALPPPPASFAPNRRLNMTPGRCHPPRRALFFFVSPDGTGDRRRPAARPWCSDADDDDRPRALAEVGSVRSWLACVRAKPTVRSRRIPPRSRPVPPLEHSFASVAGGARFANLANSITALSGSGTLRSILWVKIIGSIKPSVERFAPKGKGFSPALRDSDGAHKNRRRVVCLFIGELVWEVNRHIWHLPRRPPPRARPRS